MAFEGEVMTLDVGGTLFKTTLTTLRQYPGSMLSAMFDPSSGRPPAMKVRAVDTSWYVVNKVEEKIGTWNRFTVTFLTQP